MSNINIRYSHAQEQRQLDSLARLDSLISDLKYEADTMKIALSYRVLSAEEEAKAKYWRDWVDDVHDNLRLAKIIAEVQQQSNVSEIKDTIENLEKFEKAVGEVQVANETKKLG